MSTGDDTSSGRNEGAETAEDIGFGSLVDHPAVTVIASATCRDLHGRTHPAPPCRACMGRALAAARELARRNLLVSPLNTGTRVREYGLLEPDGTLSWGIFGRWTREEAEDRVEHEGTDCGRDCDQVIYRDVLTPAVVVTPWRRDVNVVHTPCDWTTPDQRRCVLNNEHRLPHIPETAPGTDQVAQE